MSDPGTRTRLRPSVHVAPVSDGLLFVGWQKSLVVQGSESLGTLWKALFPHLHRGVEVDTLVDALPQNARPAARKLLDELEGNGFLLGEGDGAPHDDREMPAHPHHRRTLEFLGSAAADPVAALARLQSAAVCVSGRGSVALAAARELLRLGARRVALADEPVGVELAAMAEEYGTAVTAGAGEDPAVRIVVGSPEPGAGDPWSGVPEVGVAELAAGAAVSPLRTSADAPGLAVLVNRLAGRGAPTGPAPLPETAARLAGGLAALQAFYHLTGVSTEYDGMAYSVGTERLQVTTHPLWRPGDSVAEPPADTPHVPTGTDRLNELCDERTGICAPALPGELPQTPFAMAVSADAGSAATAFGWAHTGSLARYRAVLEAARHLAGAAPARLWPLPDTDAASSAARPADAAHAVSAAGTDTAGMLAHGTQRLLARFAADPDQCAARLVEEQPAQRPARAAAPEVDAALDRAVVLGGTDLTARVLRPAAAPGLLALAEVADAKSGRVLAYAARPERAPAVAAALDHAVAVLQAGEEHDAVAQDAETPDPDGAPPAPAFAAAEALAALCRPGETAASGRWRGEPALDALGVIGWVGIVPAADEGSAR
ncbi:hypothetical protein LP52_02730 [Streptomonospora alba]|uniref:Uncharacterized protein n=1 Tax=Streptomonospora alba TaxID=183763 RepID=A0A0C2FLS0_9ACTN|nr:hypothetical protein [Streptomonospora alba]KII00240.1 hypothetical protein LP52_02730 [Streptomonospora alba]